MKLKDICTLDVACCTPTATIVEAARTMRQHHTGNLIVVDAADEDRVPAGIVTDRDIVVQVLAQGLDPARTAVRDVMVRDLVIADESEDSSTALERMRAHGVRRIPVVGERGGLVGIVALDDILRLHAEEAASLLQVVSKGQRQESRLRR